MVRKKITVRVCKLGKVGYSELLNLTILSDQRVVGGAEVYEPIPLAPPEKDWEAMESGGEHAGAPVGDEVRLVYNPNVAY